MRTLTLFLSWAVLTAPFALGGLSVESGTFLLRGGSLQTDSLRIAAPGTLEGNGTLVAPTSHIAGTLAPYGEYPAETGTLQFDGALELTGTYLCTVNGNEDLDLVSATGPASGSAFIQVQKDPAAIPLGQLVLSGSGESELSLFALPPWLYYEFRLETPSPGALALTDLRGDTDLDALPDWWEFAYYTNRTLALPSQDDDGDRSINTHEFSASTDPRNPASVFALVHVDLTESGLHRLSWNSVSGLSYSIEASLTPSSRYETVSTDLAATPPRNSWTNPAAPPAPLYYRVTIPPFLP